MFSETLKDIDRSILKELGIDAFINGKKGSVILDLDVQRVNSYGESIRNSYEISVSNEHHQLSIGDEVYCDNKRFEIVDIVEGDESITTGAANIVPRR